MKRLATRARSVRSAIALGAAVLALGVAMPAAAAGVLDQTNLAGPAGTPNASPIGPNIRQAQFFTAGLTGQLSQVSFQLVSSGTPQEVQFTFITGGVASLPSGIPASSIAFTVPTTAGGFNTVDLDLSSYGYSVVAGQQYGLMLWIATATGGTNWVFGSDVGGNLAYANGVNYQSIAGGTWNATGADRGFQTFVDTAAVPEPGTWALLIVGMGGVGAAMRRRRMTMRYRIA